MWIGVPLGVDGTLEFLSGGKLWPGNSGNDSCMEVDDELE